MERVHGPRSRSSSGSTAPRSGAGTSSSPTSSPTTSASRSRTAGRRSTTPATTEPGLDVLLEAVDYDGFEARREAARAEGRRIGLGIACYVEGTGIGPYEGAAINVQVDGTVTVATGAVEPGPGPPDDPRPDRRRRARRADRAHPRHDRRHARPRLGRRARSRAAPRSSPATPCTRRRSRCAAQAAELAARDPRGRPGGHRVRRRRGRRRRLARRRASQIGQLAAMANPLRYAFGEESARGGAATRGAMYASQDVPLPDGTTPGLNAVEYYSPASGVFGFGMHAAEVEVDEATCDVRILRYVVGHDCGRIINPIIVEGQMYGGVAQGIGGALYERMAYDEDGQLLNASFMDFLMPYATELPEPALLPHRDAVAQQRARRQGRRRGGDDPGRRARSPTRSPTRSASRSTGCRSRRRRSSSSSTRDDPHRHRHRWDVHRRRRRRSGRSRVHDQGARRRRATRRSRSCAAIEKAGTGAIAEVVARDDGRHERAARGRLRGPRLHHHARASAALLEIGRQSVPDSYGNSYFWVKPDRIVPLHLVQEVDERLDRTGRGGPRVRRGRARARSRAGSASRASPASASASCTRT